MEKHTHLLTEQKCTSAYAEEQLMYSAYNTGLSSQVSMRNAHSEKSRAHSLLKCEFINLVHSTAGLQGVRMDSLWSFSLGIVGLQHCALPT